MESFFFLEPVLVASGVDLETFKDINWNLLYRYHQDEFHMKHELRNGNLYIIGIATHNDEMRIQTSSMAIVYLLRDWNGIHSSSSIGVYDGGARAPDITLRAYMPTMPYRDRFGATSVVFEIHAGFMSPRQLRANLRVLFKSTPPQTARYAVIVQVFPGDWSAAGVQWRRDEQHPEGFQLVAALDFGIVPLSAAAKALYALQQPVDTHMPAVPIDRWVRHAVVADDTCATAFDTCCLEEFLTRDTWRCEGVWYANAHCPGTPKLFFDKADVLLSPSIPDAQKEGQFEADLHLFFMYVADRSRATDSEGLTDLED